MATIAGRILSRTLTKSISDKMVTAKKIVLAKKFDGMPKESDLQIVEETLPAVKDGGKIFVFICFKVRIALFVYRIFGGSRLFKR